MRKYLSSKRPNSALGPCAFFGVLEGPLWGIAMWLSSWQGEIAVAIAVALTVFEAVLAGVALGIIMAWYLRSKAAQLRLPSSWEDYPEA